jgi:NAD(P)-dependent dehydrogenase (short-subunit alcohol dehydrogenase family)
MPHKQVWVITGAGRGMGTDFARAALAAGHAVVATGRTPEKVAAAVGAADDLLVVNSTLRTRAMLRRPSMRPSSGSAASTCWSTTRATSSPGSSRR